VWSVSPTGAKEMKVLCYICPGYLFPELLPLKNNIDKTLWSLEKTSICHGFLSSLLIPVESQALREIFQ